MEGGRLLETGEVAKRLRCSMQHVRTLIATGKLKAMNIGAGDKLPRYRVPEEALLDYLAQAPEAATIGAMRTR